ncbi:MAG: hypothetical protein JNN07_16245 [Verrucomicrobiales bacterium]|nr:hypothetical protein [Verrucomicrobiales bacterium]
MADAPALETERQGIDPLRLRRALAEAVQGLRAERDGLSHWSGQLSSSALSTATAVVALALSDRHLGTDFASRVDEGLSWLSTYVNADGGWGDTVCSRSNLSTTVLVWAAFGAVPGADARYLDLVRQAERWITEHAGGIAPAVLAPAIVRRYGKDRTFSVPILTLCALSGRLGSGREAWRNVIPLPFELAACPARWFAALQLPVVSYALPALIAIGQVRFHHSPPRNPIVRALRSLALARTLGVLERVQPPNGGFLEATPLTSFVTMSLVGGGDGRHPVAERGLRFLCGSQRSDGSWPIDTNLATWLTTLSLNALPPTALEEADRSEILSWLMGQQYRTLHPYTQAAPGGWAWTDLPGGVPDADDTAGALVALAGLTEASGDDRARVREAAEWGVRWLLDLQNRDGGMPTFCRGWGSLPFDRSSTDITAHAMRAWLTWHAQLPESLQERVDQAMQRAFRFLETQQRSNGAWVPLWFGNEAEEQEENPAYGTSRVLSALVELPLERFSGAERLIESGFRWLMRCQDDDGGFGGAPGLRASVEETALAVEVMGKFLATPDRFSEEFRAGLAGAWVTGVNWLIRRVETGEWRHPSPIGFYFAKLWYFERLYPQIFTVGALRAALECVEPDSGRCDHRFRG